MHFGQFLEDEVINTGEALDRAIKARQGQLVERLGAYFAGLLSLKECAVYNTLWGEQVGHVSFSGKTGAFAVTVYTDKLYDLGPKVEGHLSTPMISTDSTGPVFTCGDTRNGVVFLFRDWQDGRGLPQPAKERHDIQAGYLSGTVRG